MKISNNIIVIYIHLYNIFNFSSSLRDKMIYSNSNAYLKN